jgi:hypothetical protein
MKKNYCAIQPDADYMIEDIRRLPTELDGIHESCFRSFHVLNLVCSMVKRGDSKETIIMVVKNFGFDGTIEA